MIRPYYEENGIAIYNGDCLEVMKQFEDKSFDLVLTDPPYGARTDENIDEVIMRLEESFKKIVTEGGAFVMCDYRNVHKIATSLQKTLPLVNEIIWKVGWVSGYRSFTKKKFVVNHNYILQFGNIHTFSNIGRNPKTKIRARYNTPTKRVALDTVWDDIPSVRQTSFYKIKTGHPDEKPVRLFTRILGCSGTIFNLDPFMGSGTTLVAAKKLNRKAVGIEISEKYCEMAVKRLKLTVRPLVSGWEKYR